MRTRGAAFGNQMRAGGRTMEVVRMRITEVGRQALTAKAPKFVDRAAVLGCGFGSPAFRKKVHRRPDERVQ